MEYSHLLHQIYYVTVVDIKGAKEGGVPPPIITDLQKYGEDSLVVSCTLEYAWL